MYDWAAPPSAAANNPRMVRSKYLCSWPTWKLHRNCSDALQIRRILSVCVHPGRVGHGLPVLRLYPGGYRVRDPTAGRLPGNYRAKDSWEVSHRFNVASGSHCTISTM